MKALLIIGMSLIFVGWVSADLIPKSDLEIVDQKVNNASTYAEKAKARIEAKYGDKNSPLKKSYDLKIRLCKKHHQRNGEAFSILDAADNHVEQSDGGLTLVMLKSITGETRSCILLGDDIIRSD